MNSTVTNNGHIAAYCTDSNNNRCGHIFYRFPFFHVALWDDRFQDDEVNKRYESLDDAVMAAFVMQHNYDMIDAHLNELSRVEAEERAFDTVEFWDEMMSYT